MRARRSHSCLRVRSGACFHCCVGVDDLEDDFFAFADDHGVEEGAHRFRVVAARAAGDDQRVLGAAVGGAQGEAAKVEHRQHVGIELLVGQAEADDVEVRQWVAGFQPIERDAVAAQVEFKVGPGAEDAFRQQVGAAVDAVIEHLQAEVAAAQLIDVGECQRHLGADAGICPVLGDRVEFAAGVACRLFDLVQHPVEGARDLFG